MLCTRNALTVSMLCSDIVLLLYGFIIACIVVVSSQYLLFKIISKVLLLL